MKERGIPDRSHWYQLGYAAARFTMSARKPGFDAVLSQSSPLLQTVSPPERRNDTTHGVKREGRQHRYHESNSSCSSISLSVAIRVYNRRTLSRSRFDFLGEAQADVVS
jgi:hypothetical protein